MALAPPDPELNPFLLRRRLRHELRAARERLGLTQTEVAETLHVHLSTVIRAELGRTSIAARDIAAYAKLYAIEDRAEALTALAKQSRDLPFRKHRDILTPSTLDYLAYEATANSIKMFMTDVLPGVLQTRGYVMGLLVDGLGASTSVAEKHWSIRQRRRSYVLTPSASITVVLEEAVLHRLVGGEHTRRRIMREQWQHVLAMMEKFDIHIKVLRFADSTPFTIGGQFVLLEFDHPDDWDVVYLEHAMRSNTTKNDRLIKESPDQTRPYVRQFESISGIAEPVDAPRLAAMLQQIGVL